MNVADGQPASAMSPAYTRDVVLKCIGLSKTFKDFWLRNRVKAVDQVNLEIHKGEVFGLLGPNGSGKSTTIKMILGLLHPTEGKIAVLGHAPSDVKIKQRIGYLPEETYLYRFLNPRETLDYYGKLFHQDRAKRLKRIDMLLEMVGLTHAARRPVGEFSKGMQRKVGLAQALINDPDFLILDEPTSGMDPIATADVKNVIQTLADRGKTVLLCSHLLADVQDVCHNVSIMYGGKVREEGDLDSLLSVEDKTAIETGPIDDHTLSEIEQVLERHGQHITRSERPKKKLESLFLEIVDKARAEGIETAGARQGGPIADFLAEPGVGEPDSEQDAARVLDTLMQPVEATPPTTQPQPQPQPTAGPAATDIDHDALSSLTGGAAPTAPASSSPEPSAKPSTEPSAAPPTESADQSVLDGLLGGDDKNRPDA